MGPEVLHDLQLLHRLQEVSSRSSSRVQKIEVLKDFHGKSLKESVVLCSQRSPVLHSDCLVFISSKPDTQIKFISAR